MADAICQSEGVERYITNLFFSLAVHELLVAFLAFLTKLEVEQVGPKQK